MASAVRQCCALLLLLFIGRAGNSATANQLGAGDRRQRYREYVAAAAEQLLLGMSLNGTDEHSALHLVRAGAWPLSALN